MKRALLASMLATAIWCIGAPAVAQDGGELTPFDARIAETKSYIMSDPAQALASAKAAKRLANDRLQQATSAWLEGEALTRLNRPDEARPVIERALGTIDRVAPHSKLHADLLKSMAAIDSEEGKVEDGLTHLHAAYRIYERLDETRSQAIVLHLIGSIYYEARDYAKTREYYAQARDIYAEDPALSLSAHNNLGNALRDTGELDAAAKEFRAALALAKEMDSPLLEARILNNLADTQMRQGLLAEADRTARLGLQAASGVAEEWKPYLWGSRATIAMRDGRLDDAERYLRATFANTDLSQTTVGYRDYHETAYQLYRQRGRYREAMQHLAAFKRLDDSGRDLAASTSAALLSAQFDFANRELRISRLEAEEAQRDVALQRSQATLRYALAFIAVALSLIAALVLVVLSSRRRKREANEANAKLTFTAQHDMLTGLVNRRHFREVLDNALAGPNPHNRECALLMIDLDRFKAVNDTHGHQVGDGLLQLVSKRLRDIAGQDATVCRLGGDEFAIILHPLPSEADIEQISQEIVRAIGGMHRIDGTSCTIGSSVGIAIAPQDGDNAARLLRSADLALYQAKETGRGRWVRYEPEMQREADERNALEADLRVALEEGQLSIAYQSIVDAKSTNIMAYEALLRWEHPQRGTISPDVFIPIAEDARLIDEIGSWVLRTACAEAARWPDHIRLAVNISTLQVESGVLATNLLGALAASGLAPERLELEVTESVFLDNQGEAEAMLEKLRSLGIGLVLDDFGTGYSSLGYLRRATFSTIKIDRSFTQAATSGCRNSLAVIRAIVSMAAELGMQTTAEGIETLRDMDEMRELGCSQLQGYYFSRPEHEVERDAEEGSVIQLHAQTGPRKSAMG